MPSYLSPSLLTRDCSLLRCFFVLHTYLNLPTPDPRAGEITCRTCAVVIGERCIDDGAEWRTFVDDSSNGRADPNRCGELSESRQRNIILIRGCSESDRLS